MKIDQIFEHIGNFGRYHQILYAVVFLGGIPNALILFHTVYSHYESPFHCKLPEEVWNLTVENRTEYEDIFNYSIPMEVNSNGKTVRSQCYMYNRSYSDFENFTLLMMENNSDIVACKDGYTYTLEEGQNTAIVEYSMVCGRRWMSPLVVSLLQAGMALGAFTGSLADRYGRRTIFLWASTLQVLFTVCCALSWDFYSYAAATFLVGCAQLVNYVASFVLVSEVIAVRWRNFIAISQFFSFAVGYCFEPLIGYLFPNWRHFLWAVCVLSACCYLPAFWILPESARWLMVKGRKEEGIRELKRMARMNGSKLDVDDFVKENMLEDEIEAENEKTTVLETLKVIFNSGITARFLSTFCLWFVTGLVYYAISLYSTNFSENRHVNLLCGGLSEFPAYFTVYFAVKWLGRPRTTFWLMLICGSTSIVLPFMTPPEISILRTIIAMLGKGAASGMFYASYFISAEISPTLQRSSAMSISSFTARIGGFGAPYLMVMGKDLKFLPYLFMGSMAISGGLLCLFYIPETKGVPLPDTAEEAAENRRFYRLRIFRNLAPNDKRESNGKGNVEI